ncbi:uncharacterized protein LOC143025940 [Oratosquilla oratoria]|uniref:uncharacterized protein LOC143025940 n=1 Tax=Oratosquilla oratoria TaxID=337810 RepID=UPI003F757974
MSAFLLEEIYVRIQVKVVAFLVAFFIVLAVADNIAVTVDIAIAVVANVAALRTGVLIAEKVSKTLVGIVIAMGHAHFMDVISVFFAIVTAISLAMAHYIENMSQREAIIQLHRAGKTNSEIIKLLKVAKSTVYHVVNRFKELGTSEDRPRSGRPRTARTKKVVNAVRERMRRNPKRSIRKLAKDMNVSNTLMRTIVRKDLRLSPYKMRKRQFLTPLQKQKILERAQILLRELKTDTAAQEIIFSDEKLFTIEAQFNNQNDRVYAKSSADIKDSVRTVYRRQKPSSLMVWAAISKTWKSPLIFVEQGVKINSDRYINDILVPALEEMKKHFKDHPFTFQQDGAPSHTSRKTQDWCSRQFSRFWSKEMWPPSSPDLNPMDFCVWSLLEAKACSVAHSSVDALKQSLQREWVKIPQDKLRASVENFRERIERVIRVKGDHIEN